MQALGKRMLIREHMCQCDGQHISTSTHQHASKQCDQRQLLKVSGRAESSTSEANINVYL